VGEPSEVYDVKRISGGYEDLDPPLFADRDDELGLIQHRIEAAQRGEIEHPLVEFYGVVGLGKSWLVSYLANHYWFRDGHGPFPQKPTFSAKVDFSNERFRDRYSLLRSMALQIREQLTRTKTDLAFPHLLQEGVSSSKDINVVANEFAGSIIGLLDHYIPVLAFDATEKADEELLDWLEERVVYPIIRTNRVIFVFTGRRWHRWKTFEVRRRVEPTELYPFDWEKEETTEQRTKLDVEKAESLAHGIYEYAFGHPLASKAIFKALRKLVASSELLDERVLEANLDTIKETILHEVIENQFFGELGEHDYLKPLLWGICILRKFNPTPLRHFTIHFIDAECEQKPGAFYLDAIRDMQDTTLVQWSSVVGGYILGSVVRRIMAKNLYMREPEKFRRWHREAVALYDDWIEQYPRNTAGFLIERTFHRAWALRANGKTEQEISNKLVTEFSQTLRTVEKHPDVQWDLPDIASALSEELDNDEELKETVPEDAYSEFMNQAQQFLEKFRGPWS
jgi:hypothetical protein